MFIAFIGVLMITVPEIFYKALNINVTEQNNEH